MELLRVLHVQSRDRHGRVVAQSVTGARDLSAQLGLEVRETTRQPLHSRAAVTQQSTAQPLHSIV